MVFNFSSRGPEFWELTAKGEISSLEKQKIEAKKQENIRLTQVNASNPKVVKRHM